MSDKVWKYCLAIWFLLFASHVEAQQFFNLTADEVKVDSVLPQFVYSKPLTDNYQDSIYTAKIKYAEYVDMTVEDIANYNHISGAILPSEVQADVRVAVSRRNGTLVVSFCPLVFRHNKYQMLVSFYLDIKAKAVSGAMAKAARADGANQGYAAHSVLASGRWAKIRVPETGVYQLTESVIRRAGFTDINKVKIYGYGGNLLNEALYASELFENDDLKEVSQCVVGGKHLFYAKGPVSWSGQRSTTRVRNPYSDYGYYFITQSDEAPATVDSATFISSIYPKYEDYHSLYEVDGYSWFPGGRNLYDTELIPVGKEKNVVVTNVTGNSRGRLYVSVTASFAGSTLVHVLKNGKDVASMNLGSTSEYEKATQAETSVNLTDWKIDGKDTITIHPVSGGGVRLDYISVTWNSPVPQPNLEGNLPAAEYVYNITNQDHHADGVADMVIIIPTSQKLLKQAQRLKAFHETHDGLRVTIVPADELYNEFSSGTPDAGAYRRYLRMLQDKASTEADMPKYLLLFGDCVWDNRMLTSECKRFNVDDYLLCYESENSFSKTRCYVNDSWMGILSEGMGAKPTEELQDVAVGRFPVTTQEEAKIVVDKTINYMTNDNAGDWQNTIMYMGDDGNDNIHMEDADEVAEDLDSLASGFLIKKVMWDAYTRVSSSTGNSYPEVTRLIKQQQANGALIMDYAGHGSEVQLSHEKVLSLNDFAEFKNTNLPLWVTAACDIMPFDGVTDNIGEATLLNENGGAVAFYGTTRTVYANCNKLMNRAFMRRVLSTKNGKPLTIGEAHRLAQNDLILGTNKSPNLLGVWVSEFDRSENRLQYALLGDPALALNLPKAKVVLDSINDVPATSTENMAVLKAGSLVKIAGHVENAPDFEGTVTATVRDSKEKITCKLNDTSKDGAEVPFVYSDRTKTLYRGSGKVSQGKFTLSFAVPMDINYSDATGLINLYAVNDDKTLQAHGYSEDFKIGGSLDVKNDSIGPSVYCYLNSTNFVDGGNVNSTPFFVAEIKDKDGINAAGSGIGHDLQLTIDGDMSKTYVLNDNFTFDFGSYTSGTTYYNIPELEEGPHRLQFRAWDILNNSTTTTLSFNVVKGLKPALFDIGVTENPAKNSTTFVIKNDRSASDLDVVIEIFDTSGRMLWRHSETGTSNAGVYTYKWDLSTGGSTLRTGLYLYRVKISADGSSYASKTKKLIVINN